MSHMFCESFNFSINYTKMIKKWMYELVCKLCNYPSTYFNMLIVCEQSYKWNMSKIQYLIPLENQNICQTRLSIKAICLTVDTPRKLTIFEIP